MNKETRIIFMGTPDFAAGCLQVLVEQGYNVVGVVTVADKPAGRGKKITASAVKQYAQSQGITTLQPEKLKDADFLKALANLQADLQIIVAFRMLPEVVWSMPKLGTFNLHASLLPDYRGAAPINWAIMNGETESGVTTFMIDEKIDTGEILLQEKVAITEKMTAGELHDELQKVGSRLILQTINELVLGKIQPQAQNKQAIYKEAPKLFKENTRINWEDTIEQIYNKIRGLSPYPLAWTMIYLDDKAYLFKIVKAEIHLEAHDLPIGTVVRTKKEFKVAVAHGFLNIVQAQLQGKSVQQAQDLNNGMYHFTSIFIK